MTEVLLLVGVAASLFWVLIDCVHFLMEDYSMTASALGYHKRKNRLYRCCYRLCGKMYRRYQVELYEELSGQSRCPHCEYDSWRLMEKELSSEKWMDVHPDCPKINTIQHMKIKRTIKQVKANQKAMKSQRFYEEYNNIKVDFSWIENLQKKHK